MSSHVACTQTLQIVSKKIFGPTCYLTLLGLVLFASKTRLWSFYFKTKRGKKMSHNLVWLKNWYKELFDNVTVLAVRSLLLQRPFIYFCSVVVTFWPSFTSTQVLQFWISNSVEFNEKVKAKDTDYLNLDDQIWEGAWSRHVHARMDNSILIDLW